VKVDCGSGVGRLVVSEPVREWEEDGVRLYVI
jgi:hypothetical protein